MIAIVFLASFLTLLFISKLPRGKTFDEVLAEKRQLAEKLYGPHGGQKRGGGNSGGGGGKKNQKQQLNSKKSNKTKSQKKEIEQLSEEHESENNSDEHMSDESSVPPVVTSHVEFVDVQIIPSEPINVGKKLVAQPNKAPNPPKRKNSKSPGTGILINKSEQSLVKNVVTVEQLNTFNEIIPKDVVELKKDNVSFAFSTLNYVFIFFMHMYICTFILHVLLFY